MNENQKIYVIRELDGSLSYELTNNNYWWGTLTAEEVGQLMGGN